MSWWRRLLSALGFGYSNMAANWTELHIPLQRGREAKAHKFAVKPPALLTSQNTVYDDVGAIKKRTGHDSVALGTNQSETLDDLWAIIEHNARPVLLANEGIHDWDGALWQTRRSQELPTKDDYFQPVALEMTDVFNNGQSQLVADFAIGATAECCVWYNLDADRVEWSFRDRDSGAILETESPSQALSGSEKPRVIHVNGHFFIFFIDTSGILRVKVVDGSNIYAEGGDPGGLGATFTLVQSATVVHYDIAPGLTTAHVAYTFGGTLYVNDVTTGGVVGTARNTTRTSNDVVACAGAFNNSALAVLRHDTTNTYIDYYNFSTFTDKPGKVNLTLVADAPDNSLVIVVDSNGSDDIAYCYLDTRGGGGGSDFWRLRGYTNTFSTGTSVSLGVLVRHCVIASKPFIQAEGKPYIVVTYAGKVATVATEEAEQDQYWLLDASRTYNNSSTNYGFLARFLPGEAYYHNSAYTFSSKVAAQNFNPALFAQTVLAYRVNRLSNSDRSDVFYSEWGLKRVEFDFTSITVDAAQAGGTTYLTGGGFLAEYDGKTLSESQFWVYPSQIETSVSTSGGRLTDNSTYRYRVYWESRNAAGELEQSTFAASLEISTTTGGAADDNSVTITVPTLPTNKKDVRLAVYRTTASNGLVYYRASRTTFPTYNDPEADTVTWTDSASGFSDAEIVNNEPDLLFNGSLPDNVAANTPKTISVGQNRLFYIRPEDDNRVYFSKLRENGKRFSFNEKFQIAVPETGGRVVALDAGEDSLWIFKETAVYVASGQGPNNAGDGAYGQPQIIAQGLGCENAKSVIRISNGVVFKSQRGWYLADRGYNVRYIGSGVADLDNLTVTGIVDRPSQHRFEAYTSSTVLVYDYLVDSWSTWDIGALSVVEIDDTVWSITASAARKSNSSIWQDSGSAYYMQVETAWVPLRDILARGRVKRFAVLAEYRDKHNLQVEVAYDRQEAWVDDLLIDMTGEVVAAPTVGDAMRPRRRTSRQKVSAIKFRLTDSQYNPSGGGVATPDDSLILNGISLEIAPLGGVNKQGINTDGSFTPGGGG